jgi:hypothetical protein
MPNEGKPAMHLDAIPFTAVEGEIVWPSVEDQIAAFLDGRTQGEELLRALYDHVLDEPIPPQMKALLHG